MWIDDNRQPERGSTRIPLPIAQASRIVLDAMEVDWSVEPRSEYEAEIRRTYLSQQLERGPLGRMDIVDLATGMDEIGSDLREAVEAVHMLSEARAAIRQRRLLRTARIAVDRQQPQS